MFIMVSLKEDADFAKFLQGQRFSTTFVEVEFLFLVIDCHIGWRCVQFVVQVSNFIGAFSGLTGEDTQESIMNVSVMNTVMFVIQGKERDMD